MRDKACQQYLMLGFLKNNDVYGKHSCTVQFAPSEFSVVKNKKSAFFDYKTSALSYTKRQHCQIQEFSIDQSSPCDAQGDDCTVLMAETQIQGTCHQPNVPSATFMQKRLVSPHKSVLIPKFKALNQGGGASGFSCTEVMLCERLSKNI